MSAQANIEKSRPGRDAVAFVATWLALLVLAGASFGLSYLHLGRWGMMLAMAIAALKALLVGLVFMELRKERFTLLAVAGISVLFVVLLAMGVVGDAALR